MEVSVKKIINPILLAGLAIGSMAATEENKAFNNPNNVQSSSKLANVGASLVWTIRKATCASLVGTSATSIAMYVTAPILIKSFKRQMLLAAVTGNHNALEYYFKNLSGENSVAIAIEIFERFVPMLPGIAAITGAIGLAGLIF